MTRSRLRLACGEAVAGLNGAGLRGALVLLVPMMAVAGLLCTVGVGRTASAQLSRSFDRRAARLLTLHTDPPSLDDDHLREPFAVDHRGAQSVRRRLRMLRSVSDAGFVVRLGGSQRLVLDRLAFNASARAEVIGVSAGWFHVAGADVGVGRSFDTGHERRADGVAVLGWETAERLGMSALNGRQLVRINGEVLLVLGVLARGSATLEYANTVMVPVTALERIGTVGPRVDTVLRIPIAAGPLAAREAALVIDPSCARCTNAVLPPEPEDFRVRVEADLRSNLQVVFAGLAAFGVVLVAASRIVDVNRRRRELALRRAIGATRSDIALQVTVEGVLATVAAAAVGAVLGNGLVVVVAVWRSWVPVLAAEHVFLACAVAALVGALAGAVAAMVAVKVEPEAALRQA